MPPDTCLQMNQWLIRAPDALHPVREKNESKSNYLKQGMVAENRYIALPTTDYPLFLFGRHVAEIRG